MAVNFNYCSVFAVRGAQKRIQTNSVIVSVFLFFCAHIIQTQARYNIRKWSPGDAFRPRCAQMAYLLYCVGCVRFWCVCAIMITTSLLLTHTHRNTKPKHYTMRVVLLRKLKKKKPTEKIESEIWAPREGERHRQTDIFDRHLMK